MHPAARQIEDLRRLRARPAPEQSIRPLIESTAAEAGRTFKTLGEIIELWERLVPADLASQTCLSGLRGGILHVIVDSSSVAFELDRLLRAGLLADLRRQYRGSLVNVKTRIGKLDREFSQRKKPQMNTDKHR